MLHDLLTDWYNIIGIIGVLLILWTYLMVQIGRMDAPTNMGYSVVNLVGSVMIVVSLIYHFNLASFIIEIAWVLISIYGIFRCWRYISNKKQHGESNV
jgi:hypothetical protein